MFESFTFILGYLYYSEKDAFLYTDLSKYNVNDHCKLLLHKKDYETTNIEEEIIDYKIIE